MAAATGNASSTILCDCEAGLDRYVGPGGDESLSHARRPARGRCAIPRAALSQATACTALERSLLVRISQNVLTCPTTACFNLLDTDPYFKLGRKIAFFGDGYQFRDVRHGRKVWVMPILGGEFVIDRRFGFRDGLMGGNLWFFGARLDAAAGSRRAGGPGRRGHAGRDHALSRRRGRQRLEGRQPLQVHHRQHLRRLLPHAAREAGRAVAGCRRAWAR